MSLQKPVQLHHCHNMGGNQVFHFTHTHQIKIGESCLDGAKPYGPVIMYPCHNMQGNQQWMWNKEVNVFLKYLYSDGICYNIK